MKTFNDIRKTYTDDKSVEELKIIAARAWSVVECYEGNDIAVFYCAMAELKQRLTSNAFNDFEETFLL